MERLFEVTARDVTPRLHARGAGLERGGDPAVRSARLPRARNSARLLHGQPGRRVDHVARPGARAGERLILGLETSCDETAAALVDRRRRDPRQRRLLAGGAAREIRRRRPGGRLAAAPRARHAGYARGAPGGRRRARPRRADRRHPGPGLIGALLVGLSAAKALAWALRLPLDPGRPPARPRRLALPQARPGRAAVPLPARQRRPHAPARRPGPAAASGSSARRSTTRPARRSTRARACSGSAIPAARRSTGSRARATPRRTTFPVARVPGLDFSFSGLKTALLYKVRELDADELERAPRRPRRLLSAGDRRGPSSSGPKRRRSRSEPTGSRSSAASLRIRSCAPRSRAPRSRRSSSAPTTRR